MIKVTILGSGNVATHLIRAFLKATDIKLVEVFSRNIESIQYLKGDISITDDINMLKEVDVYIISISDDVISQFSTSLNLRDKLVVHTSGSVSMENLIGEFKKGVFYPLQTFSKNKKISLKKIPICIESENEKELIILKKLASSISNQVFIINSNQRKKLHLAAVFVNNFTNHLYQIGNEICEESQVPFEILLPLIKETAKKVRKLTPNEAQTGPAKRNDFNTIEEHLSVLTGKQKEIYNALTQSIIKTYT